MQKVSTRNSRIRLLLSLFRKCFDECFTECFDGCFALLNAFFLMPPSNRIQNSALFACFLIDAAYRCSVIISFDYLSIFIRFQLARTYRRWHSLSIPTAPAPTETGDALSVIIPLKSAFRLQTVDSAVRMVCIR